MKEETQTIHKEKINGVPCRGAIFIDLSQSRLSKALGYRQYKCEKCGQQWAWSDPIDKKYK